MSSSTTGIHPAFIEEHRLRGKDHRDLDFGRKFEEWLKIISSFFAGLDLMRTDITLQIAAKRFRLPDTVEMLV
uniref:Uncharacterized protein n=1 Tax=Parascaris equorum TaxID=6256 RepID=A0A914RWU5_PAREQ